MSVVWALCCDRPGCFAQLQAEAPYDELAMRRAHERARDAGWSLAKSADVPLDFCPVHAEIA